MAVVQVLVVDDSPSWQDFIQRHLSFYPNASIVGMEADGLEAVRKAEQLQPDLVLLDINLPSLNGIEVARQIRKVTQKSAILFLSAEDDPDIVRAAFEAGGHGYVLKHEAVLDLLIGMEAVLLGKRFSSRGLGYFGDLT